jgi:hypothetical protein
VVNRGDDGGLSRGDKRPVQTSSLIEPFDSCESRLLVCCNADGLLQGPVQAAVLSQYLLTFAPTF